MHHAHASSTIHHPPSTCIIRHPLSTNHHATSTVHHARSTCTISIIAVERMRVFPRLTVALYGSLCFLFHASSHPLRMHPSTQPHESYRYFQHRTSVWNGEGCASARMCGINCWGPADYTVMKMCELGVLNQGHIILYYGH